jgi:hypothetical protein
MPRGPTFFAAGYLGGYSAEVLSDSPSIYLKLDEVSGTNYADSSGNGVNGTGHNTITQGEAGVFSGSSSAIKFTTADSAYIDFGSDPLTGGSLTFELFFKVTNLTQMNALFARGMGAGDFSIYARVNTDGSLQWGIVTTSGGSVQHDQTGPASAITAGVAYHAVFRWISGTGMGIALNGASGATALNFAHTGLRAGADGLQVGRMVTPIYASATIDEFAVYNHALADARIAAHYTARNT